MEQKDDCFRNPIRRSVGGDNESSEHIAFQKESNNTAREMCLSVDIEFFVTISSNISVIASEPSTARHQQHPLYQIVVHRQGIFYFDS
jgi:hypothetical protein